MTLQLLAVRALKLEEEGLLLGAGRGVLGFVGSRVPLRGVEGLLVTMGVPLGKKEGCYASYYKGYSILKDLHRPRRFRGR